jgi:DNA invertase Pin-like site-specific DNA recombinase
MALPAAVTGPVLLVAFLLEAAVWLGVRVLGVLMAPASPRRSPAGKREHAKVHPLVGISPGAWTLPRSPPEENTMNTRLAGLYLRVSTDRQTTGNQLADLDRLVRARGFEPVIFEEVESAARARPVLDRLLADARSGKLAAVAVWALDRLHRSMVGAIQVVLELDRLGVRVVSVREPWLDTDSPVRPLLVAIFGWVAEQERTRLIERTKAGMSRARREGKMIGRPRTSTVLLHAAAELVATGVPVAEAARRKGVSRASLRRWMAERAGTGAGRKAPE